MKKSKLEISLSDKSLEFEGNILPLDTSLKNAIYFSKSESGETTDYIELHYSNKDEEFTIEESENIYEFVSENNLPIAVSPCPKTESNYSVIGLFGNFDAEIYRTETRD